MFFHHPQKQLQACKYYICSLYQELCGELHAKINVVDEERYDIEAKVHHNTREVKKQFITVRKLKVFLAVHNHSNVLIQTWNNKFPELICQYILKAKTLSNIFTKSELI